jgi:hypothetical protein
VVKDRFQHARELIKQKRYDEARALLRTIDDIRALEWLDKLDQIAPTHVAPAPTRVDDVVEQLKAAEGLIRAGKYRQARENLRTIKHPGATRLLTAIDEIQAEKRRRSIRRTFVLGAMAALIALVAFIGVTGTTLMNQEHVYEDQLIRVRYKFPWTKIDSPPQCPLGRCKLMLEHAFLSNRGIAILWWDEGMFISNNDLHTAIYDHYLTLPEIDQSTIQTFDWEFKGGPAVLVNYYAYHPMQFYHTELWFSEGSVIFAIDRVTRGEQDYAYLQVQFDPILESIEFK